MSEQYPTDGIEYGGHRIYEARFLHDDNLMGKFFVKIAHRWPGDDTIYLLRDLSIYGECLPISELMALQQQGIHPTPLSLIQSGRSGYFDNEEQAKLYIRLWNKRNPDGRPEPRWLAASDSTIQAS